MLYAPKNFKVNFMQETQWYKINLPIDDSLSILWRFKSILDFIDSVKINDVACYTKVAHNGSCNAFLSAEVVNHLKLDLQKYNPVECSVPQNKTDGDGSLLSYIFGNPNILP